MGSERRVTVLGLSTRVLEAGEGGEEAVVFVHGGPGSARDWTALLPVAGSLGRAVAFDLPGFGEADTPRWVSHSALTWSAFMAGVLDRLGIRRAHLVLHDLGGQAGLAWACAHPDRFASAVLIDTGVLVGYRWHAVARLHRMPGLRHVAAATGGVGLRATMRRYEPGLSAGVLDRWRREYDGPARRAMLGFYASSPAASMGLLAPELRRLDRPALVIWGARDRFVPREQAERQRETFPSARVVTVDDCGHYPHLEAPDRVAGQVLPFLADRLGGPPNAEAPGSREPGASWRLNQDGQGYVP